MKTITYEFTGDYLYIRSYKNFFIYYNTVAIKKTEFLGGIFYTFNREDLGNYINGTSIKFDVDETDNFEITSSYEKCVAFPFSEVVEKKSTETVELNLAVSTEDAVSVIAFNSFQPSENFIYFCKNSIAAASKAGKFTIKFLEASPATSPITITMRYTAADGTKLVEKSLGVLQEDTLSFDIADVSSVVWFRIDTGVTR